MSQDLTVICEFLSPIEAAVIKGQLEEVGIPALLDGQLVGSTLSHLKVGLHGTKVLVASDKADQALELLAQFRSDREQSADQSVTREPWICPACAAEVDAEFEVCWSCGDSKAEIHGEEPSTAEYSASEESHARSAKSINGQSADDLADLSRRAFNAAVIGLLLFPPALHLYSLYQLVNYQLLQNRTGRGWDLYALAALCIDLLVIMFSLNFVLEYLTL